MQITFSGTYEAPDFPTSTGSGFTASLPDFLKNPLFLAGVGLILLLLLTGGKQEKVQYAYPGVR